MATTDAMPVPIKNTAFLLTFDWRLNTGAMLSGAAGVSAQISKDGAAFGNCAHTPTEIGTSGIYTQLFDAAEMNYDTVAVKITSSTTNALPFTVIFYPQDTGNIKVDVQSINASATAATRQQLLADSAKSYAVDSTNFTPTTTQFDTTLTTNTATDFYKGRSIIFTSGTLIDQVARITGSAYVGAPDNCVRLTVTTLTAAPANAVTFSLC